MYMKCSWPSPGISPVSHYVLFKCHTTALRSGLVNALCVLLPPCEPTGLGPSGGITPVHQTFRVLTLIVNEKGEMYHKTPGCSPHICVYCTGSCLTASPVPVPSLIPSIQLLLFTTSTPATRLVPPSYPTSYRPHCTLDTSPETWAPHDAAKDWCLGH